MSIRHHIECDSAPAPEQALFVAQLKPCVQHEPPLVVPIVLIIVMVIGDHACLMGRLTGVSSSRNIVLGAILYRPECVVLIVLA